MCDDSWPRLAKDMVSHRCSYETTNIEFGEPARTSNVIVCSFELEAFCNSKPIDGMQADEMIVLKMQ